MLALSVINPWAWALVTGVKPVENRTWAPPKSVIGQTVAIHASKTYDREGEAFLRDCGVVPPPKFGEPVPPTMRLRGAILGTVQLVGVVHEDEWISSRDPIFANEMFFGPYGWKVTGARQLSRPIPCKGALGLWRVPDEVAADIEQQARKGGGGG